MKKRIRITHNTFLNISGMIKSENIVLEDDGVVLDTNVEGLAVIKVKGFSYELVMDKQKEVVKKAIQSKWFILGVAIFMIAIIINTARVDRIRINGDYPINREIETYIKRNCKYLGPLTFLDTDLKILNQNIRANYSNYEWVSVTKKGNIIDVTISESPVNEVKETDPVFGDIVAKKSGVIKSICIYKGKKVVEYNDYVSKGDLLVSGDLLYGIEETSLVSSKGLILAETYEEITVNVQKAKSERLFTGNVDVYQNLFVFGKNITFNKEDEYRMFDTKEETVFDIFGVIKYFYVENYEKSDIITVYNTSDAILYGKNYIENNFMLTQVSSEERIIAIEVLKTEENKDYFIVTFLVKKLESIGEFVRR